MKECVQAEDGKVSIDFEIASAFNVFNKFIGLQGLLSMLEIESERYVAQNGRDCIIYANSREKVLLAIHEKQTHQMNVQVLVSIWL